MSSGSTSQNACPLCGESARFLFTKNAIGIVECRRCKHQFADLEVTDDHVNRVYDDAYFTGGGAGYADYLADSHLRISQGRRYAKLLQQFTVPGYMLDIGCAAGNLLSGFIQAGWKGEGIEPNAQMAARAKASGLNVQRCTLEQYVPTREFDLVALIQVLPHLSNVAGCVEKVSRMVRPGGLCLVESWNRRSLTAGFFGKHWHEYSPPSVLHWFDRTGMNDLMRRFGLSPLANGRTWKWISVRHAQSLLRHTLSQNALGRNTTGAARLFPRHLRVPYPGDDLVWMLFEKSL